MAFIYIGEYGRPACMAGHRAVLVPVLAGRNWILFRGPIPFLSGFNWLADWLLDHWPTHPNSGGAADRQCRSLVTGTLRGRRHPAPAPRAARGCPSSAPVSSARRDQAGRRPPSRTPCSQHERRHDGRHRRPGDRRRAGRPARPHRRRHRHRLLVLCGRVRISPLRGARQPAYGHRWRWTAAGEARREVTSASATAPPRRGPIGPTRLWGD